MLGKTALIVLFFTFLTFLAVLINFGVYFEKQSPKVVADNEVTINYWEDLINKNPTYRPAREELKREQSVLGKKSK